MPLDELALLPPNESQFGPIAGVLNEGVSPPPPPPPGVPEPKTLALLGAWLAGLGFVLRRRRPAEDLPPKIEWNATAYPDWHSTAQLDWQDKHGH